MGSDLALQLLRQEVVEQGRSVVIEATGQSMRPLVRAGQKILISPCAPEALRPGEMILFQIPHGFIFHRLKRIEKTGSRPAGWKFVTQGDANCFPDPPIGAADIVGRGFPFSQGLFERARWHFLNVLTILLKIKLGNRYEVWRLYAKSNRVLKRAFTGYTPSRALNESVLLAGRLILPARSSRLPPSVSYRLVPKTEVSHVIDEYLRAENASTLQTLLEEPWREWLEAPDNLAPVVAVAEERGKIAGILVADRLGERALSVELIEVCLDRRRRGIGKNLVEQTEKLARKGGVTSFAVLGSGLFFPGLDLSQHQAAAELFTQLGYGASFFVREMVATDIVSSPGAYSAGGIQFELLEDLSDAQAFLGALPSRAEVALGSSLFNGDKLMVARREEAIIGYSLLAPLQRYRGVSAQFLRSGHPSSSLLSVTRVATIPEFAQLDIALRARHYDALPEGHSIVALCIGIENQLREMGFKETRQFLRLRKHLK